MPKFPRPRPLSPPSFTSEEQECEDISLGLRTDIPVRALPLGASPYMEGVRIDKRSLTKDFGNVALGSGAPATVLCLVEHGFINDSKVTKEYFIRMYKSGGTLILERWNGSSWVSDTSLAATFNEEGIRAASTLGVLLIALPQDNILARVEDITRVKVQRDTFEAGTITTLGGTKAASLTLPGAGSALSDIFTIKFHMFASMTDGDRLRIKVRALQNGVELDSRTFESVGENVSEDVELVVETSDSSDIILTIHWIDLKGGPQANFSDHSLTLTPDSGTQWTGTKSENPSEFDQSEYIFNYILEPQDETELDTHAALTVQFQVNTGSGFNTVSERTFSNSDDIKLQDLTQSITVNNAPSGSQFRILISNQVDPTDDWEIIEAFVTFKTVEMPEDPGYEFEVTPDEIIYQYEQTVTGPVIERISTAPKAFWVDSFADRAVALWDDGDTQIFGWSANGIFDEWEEYGSGRIILVDTRVEPIDPLQATAPVGEEHLAIFRERSIMRAYRTGQASPAIGVRSWIPGIGTKSPFSIRIGPPGVLFFGSDKMVYLLTSNGLTPMGSPIHEEVGELTFDPALVQSGYDYVHQEYALCIPPNKWYFLDLLRYFSNNEVIWRYREENFERVSVTDLTDVNNQSRINFACDGHIVRRMDSTSYQRAGSPHTGLWESPMLNQKGSSNEETLKRLVLLVDSPDAVTLDVDFSGDGGVTWPQQIAGNVLASNGEIQRVEYFPLNLTGFDLRFRIRFEPDSGLKVPGFIVNTLQRSELPFA